MLEFIRISYYYRSIRIDDKALGQRIREIAQVRVRYGYQRFTCFCGARAGRIRALTVVYNIYRECLAPRVDHSMKAEQVVSIMEGL